MGALTSFPVIKTSRLLLRSLDADDRKAIFLLRSDEQVSKFIQRNRMTSEAEADGFIGKIRSNVERGPDLYWAICLNMGPDLIGTICLWNFSEDRKQAELGYELFPAFQGRGLMAEAVKVVLDYGFRELALTTVEAYTHKENIRSKKILEKFQFRYLPDKTETGNDAIEVYSLVVP
jgi:[ribosomal protein S5]-alanine N-acetyltransferase